jgi:hypothetical protein
MVSLASLDDAGANDLGRAIAGRQLLHIDVGELYRLRCALRSGAAGEKGDADHSCTGENHGFLHSLGFLGWLPLTDIQTARRLLL